MSHFFWLSNCLNNSEEDEEKKKKKINQRIRENI